MLLSSLVTDICNTLYPVTQNTSPLAIKNSLSSGMQTVFPETVIFTRDFQGFRKHLSFIKKVLNILNFFIVLFIVTLKRHRVSFKYEPLIVNFYFS
jgi:hypothetical protein